jgi:hypothetical protein
MAGHEITTILGGSRGVPPLMIRDHGAWEQQAATENRARVDEQIKAAVADIERGDTERRYAQPLQRADLVDGMRANAALAAEAREAPSRVMRQLEECEALVAGLAASEPPQPSAEQARRVQDNEYSYGLAAWMAAHR